MTTWLTLRTAIRDELKDTTVDKYRWSDDLLFLYVKDALNDYSLWFPDREDRLTLVKHDSGYYTLPDDYVETIYVECPQDRYLEQRRPKPGVRYPSREGSKPFFYHIQGGKLYLGASSSEDVLLTYNKVHGAPASIDDDAHIFTVPVSDEELIRLFILAKCYGYLRSRQSALDRFKDRSQSGSSRQDNPLNPEVEDLMKEYYRKLYDRVGGGTIQLYRSGRMR